MDVRKIGIMIIALVTMLGFAKSFAGTILVTNALSNTVTLLDETTLQRIKELPVGFMPHEVEVTPNGQLALVSNFGDITNLKPGNSITLIDILNQQILQTITLPKNSRPHGIKFISDTEALVTAQGIQSLLVIDVVNGKVIKTIPLPGAGAHMVIVDAELRYAYVSNVNSGTLCKIDLKSFSVIDEVKIGKEAEGLALTRDETFLLVTDRTDNYVAVLRVKDLMLIKNIKTDLGPVRVTMFDNDRYAVVTNTVSGTAQTIDISTLTINKTFKTTLEFSVLPVPINIFVKKDQISAYITNSFACNIALVNLVDGKVLKTFKASHMPDGIAFSNLTL